MAVNNDMHIYINIYHIHTEGQARFLMCLVKWFDQTFGICKFENYMYIYHKKLMCHPSSILRLLKFILKNLKQWFKIAKVVKRKKKKKKRKKTPNSYELNLNTNFS